MMARKGGGTSPKWPLRPTLRPACTVESDPAMPRSASIVVVGAVAAGVAALVWFVAGGSGSPSAPPAVDVTNDGAETAELGGAAAAAAVVAAPIDPDADVVGDDFVRTAFEAEPVAVLPIQVWSREQGVAAAGAEVFVLPSHKVDWGPMQGPFAPHWSSLAETKGIRHVAGSDGRVDACDVATPALVAARLPGAFGFVWVGEVDAEGRPVEVLLRDDETIVVRVVGEHGLGVAGVAVGIGQRRAVVDTRTDVATKARELESTLAQIRAWIDANPGLAERAADKFASVQQEYDRVRTMAQRIGPPAPPAEAPLAVFVRRRTDAQGLAVIEHFQVHRERWREERAREAKVKGKESGTSGKQVIADPWFEAALLVPLVAPVTAAFSCHALPASPVELLLPPTGTLVLRTVDRDGRPFVHPVHVTIGAEVEPRAGWASVEIEKPQGASLLEIPHVGVGATFQLRARLDDDDFRFGASGVLGPGRSGERREVDFVVGRDLGMLHAQLVDEGGQPLGDVAPTLLLTSLAGRIEGEQLRTGDDGRFHLPYKVEEPNRPARFEVRLERGGVVHGHVRTLPALPMAHVTELGRIVLAPLPPIAHGRVVDDRGEPVAGATVALEQQRPSGKNGELQFVEQAFVSVRSDADGRFVLAGELAPAAAFRLRVAAQGHFVAHVERFGPERELEVRLVRIGRVVGTVVLPEGLRRESVAVVLRPVAVDVPVGETVGERRDHVRHWRGRDYAFFDRVRPGTYDVTFGIDGWPEPFLRVDRVVLAPGQTDVHPRLVDLDLTRFVHRYVVHAVDEFGQPVEVGEPQLARLVRQDGAVQFVGLPWKGRRAEWFLGQPSLHLVPSNRGHLADPHVLLPGESRVVFRASPPVVLTFAGLRAAAGNRPVHVTVEPARIDSMPDRLEGFDQQSSRIADWYRATRAITVPIAADDTATVPLSATGAHRVTLVVGRKPQQRLVPLGEIQVPAVAGPPIAVPFAADSLQY